MSNHTPGKWIYEPSDMTIRTMDFSSNAGMGDYKGVIIAELDSPEWRKIRPDSIPEKEANARVIAAAPEMLEVLKQVEKRFDWDPKHALLMDNIKALLARIEGGE